MGPSRGAIFPADPRRYDLLAEPRVERMVMLRPQALIGTWRRFGSVGPVYEIIGVGEEWPDHDRMMRGR
jgi:hypothetical protein